ncbi:MAG: protein kinase [Deltaproteobacteria bacterium]|nr:protein kinase [Deltaproteobacteria bacterium]
MGISGSAFASNWTPGPGQTIGKFTLLDRIGEGGMARLYLARTAGLGGFVKRVVVKQILPHLAEDAEFIARFIQEARLAATLDHPNIATVYEVDVEDGIYFYSMEYVRGRDLRQVLRRVAERGQVLRIDEIVAIISALCAGLAHAHTKRDAEGSPLGIVHRDVSPSNVLVGFEGAVKLTDFGVAKARTGLVATEAGMLRGKIPYMSPEQCRGEAVDRRSDVYAVGVLLWEMLTGERLHRCENEVGLIHKIARADAPSPRPLRPDCPPRLEAIVMKALERSAATRYQSAASLRDDLEEFARKAGLGLSGSTVARLMAAQFTEAIAAELTPTDTIEPAADGTATATVAPNPDTGTETAPVLTQAAAHVVSDDAPTQSVARPTPVDTSPQPRSRSWAGPTMGLALGVVLGGGGLYLGSTGSSDAEPLDTAARAPVVAVDPPSAKTSPLEPPPRTPAVEPSTPVDVEPIPVPPSAPAATIVEPKPKPTTPRSKKPTRRRPRKKSSNDAAPLNLDSAMPPGLDGR